MKKIMVLGTGAQGSTIAKRLDENSRVSEIRCADYDQRAAEELGRSLCKANAMQVDATCVQNIIQAAEGCDLIVNGLPLSYNLAVMEAALSVNASYLDMAGPMEEIGFLESYMMIFSEWDQKFKDKGLTALIGGGSAPGLANVMARDAVDRMDTCDTIGIYVYEGLKTRRFTPFWWSPEVAFKDMAYKTFRFENGTHVVDKPFSRPVMMQFKGMKKKVRMVDHEHDEPVTMGLMSDKVLKGVKNVDFKYGGTGLELSEHLYYMGLLSEEKVKVNGATVAPLDLVLELCPPAPKYPEEIKEIINDGVITEEAAFLVRVDGSRNGKPIRIDAYADAPGLVEAFEETGLTHETFITGQCAAVFARMMAEGVFVKPGVYVPEQLNADEREYYFNELANLGVTVDTIVEEVSS